MKRATLILVSFLWILLSLNVSVRSQVTNSVSADKIINVFGKISQVDSDKKQITLSSQGGGIISISTDENSQLKRVPAGETTLERATSISFGEITVGDSAFVRGISNENASILARQVVVVSQSDATRKKEERLEEWKTRGISGVVKNIDPITAKISVELKGENSKLIEVVPAAAASIQRYRLDAANMEDYSPSNIQSIKTGDQIRALGSRSADGQQYIAEEIFTGVFQVINGKIESVDVAMGELVVADKENKKIIVQINKDSKFKRLTKEVISTISSNTKASSPTKETAGGQPKSLNLTRLLEGAMTISASDVKAGENLVIATASDAKSGKVIGLTLVVGIDLLLGQQDSKGRTQTFNLDVF